MLVQIGSALIRSLTLLTRVRLLFRVDDKEVPLQGVLSSKTDRAYVALPFFFLGTLKLKTNRLAFKTSQKKEVSTRYQLDTNRVTIGVMRFEAVPGNERLRTYFTLKWFLSGMKHKMLLESVSSGKTAFALVTFVLSLLEEGRILNWIIERFKSSIHAEAVLTE